MKIVLHLATVVCVLMVQISGHRITKRSSGASGSSEESDSTGSSGSSEETNSTGSICSSDSTCPQGPVPTDEQCQLLDAAFTNQDFNGDCQLTLDEFQQLFDNADTDNNGLLNFIEFGFNVTTFDKINQKLNQYFLWELIPTTEIARADLPQILANHNVCDGCTCGITLEEYKTYYLQNRIFG